MAATVIANVIVPEVFNPYVVERTADIARFLMGGILSSNPELDALASSGGKVVNMPFWSDLTGDDEVLSDSSPLTVGAIGSGQDQAVLYMRGRAFGVNDLAKALSGDDPMGAIAELVATYWARRYRSIAISSLTGVFLDNSTADSSDMISDISVEIVGSQTADTKLSAEAVINGVATFGDAVDTVVGIAMHSDMYYALQKLDLISFVKESQGSMSIERYRGLIVVVDDNCPKRAGTTSGFVYTTYLFGSGALGLGQGAAPVPTETDRDSLQGDDILVTRTHFLMHPRGVAFISGSVAGASPTNAEAALAANWNRVYERKNVKIASIVSN